MNFLNDVKVSFKIGILIFVAFLSLCAIGFTGFYYLQQSKISINEMYVKHLIPVKLANELCTNMVRANVATMELMLTTDGKRKEELKQLISDIGKESKPKYDILDNLELDSTSKELLEKVHQVRKVNFSAREPVIALAMDNKNQEAYDLYVKTVNPVAGDLMKQLNNFGDYYEKVAEKMNADNQAAFAKATQITVSILLLAFAILGLTGLYITKIITKPLYAMVQFCKELSSGDFREKALHINRTDEIGQLEQSLVNMKNSLRQLMKKVNESAEYLASSSQQLMAGTEQSTQAAVQVSDSIAEVSAVAQEQVGVATNTSTVVQEMSASIQQVVANTNEVEIQSVKAAEKAKLGNESVNKAANQMVNIEQTVTASAEVVTQLGERSKEIGQIIDTISNIAGQTNLLALNAAIEAARAGEQGRGFAVVAEEVRKLAEQSQDAAKKIAKLISDIQSDTEKAVNAMNAGTREVKLGTEVVNASGEVFREIAIMVAHVSGQTNEIATAIEQLALGSQQIIKSVETVNSLSKKTSAETQSVSAATEEQSASMEQIASSSQTLSNLAMGLRDNVNKFQI